MWLFWLLLGFSFGVICTLLAVLLPDVHGGRIYRS